MQKLKIKADAITKEQKVEALEPFFLGSKFHFVFSIEVNIEILCSWKNHVRCDQHLTRSNKAESIADAEMRRNGNVCSKTLTKYVFLIM